MVDYEYKNVNGKNVKTKYILCSFNASTNFDERSHVIRISKNIKKNSTP